MQIQVPPILSVPFDDLPPEVGEALHEGFSHIADLSPASLKLLASEVSRWVDLGHVRPTPIVLDPPVEAETLDLMASAAAFQATALFSPVRRMSTEDFVAGAVRAGIVGKEHAEAVSRFGSAYLNAHKEDIENALGRSYASTQIIPSLSGIQALVDLRLVGTRGSRAIATPVVIMGLTTDVEGERLIFQMTPRDVNSLLKQLKGVSRRLEEAGGMTILKEEEGKGGG